MSRRDWCRSFSQCCTTNRAGRKSASRESRAEFGSQKSHPAQMQCMLWSCLSACISAGDPASKCRCNSLKTPCRALSTCSCRLESTMSCNTAALSLLFLDFDIWEVHDIRNVSFKPSYHFPKTYIDYIAYINSILWLLAIKPGHLKTAFHVITGTLLKVIIISDNSSQTAQDVWELKPSLFRVYRMQVADSGYSIWNYSLPCSEAFQSAWWAFWQAEGLSQPNFEFSSGTAWPSRRGHAPEIAAASCEGLSSAGVWKRSSTRQ